MENRKLTRRLATTIFVYFLVFNLFGQDRYVSTTGTDVGGCASAINPCRTIQYAIDRPGPAGDVISVAAGTYEENITIDESITILGSNAGTAGYGSRSAETIIVPASTDIIDGTVITVVASNVTINGVTISGDNSSLPLGPNSTTFDALRGVYLDATASAYSNLTIINNILEDFPRDNTSAAGNPIDGTGTVFSAALGIEGSTSQTTGHTVRNNLFRDIDDEPNNNYSDQLGYGLILQDSAYADVSSNKFLNVGGGIFITDVPKETVSDSLVIDTCYFNNSKVGVLLVNGETNVTLDSVTIENSRAFGIRIVRAGSSADDIDFYIRNSFISETGNALSNYSGLASETYSGTGTVTVTVDSCTISDNQNRGLTFRGNVADGTNIGYINNSTIEGNAYNGIGSNAFGIIVNRGAQLTISESILSNSSTNRTATTYDAVLGANNGNGSIAGIVTVRSSSLTATTGTIALAQGTSPQMDASGNWWGTTVEATINTNTTAADFSPWLSYGTDENANHAGFQPDLDRMNVGLLATQTGSSEFIQEGITSFTDADTLVLHAGTYAENPVVDRNVVFETIPTVILDSITMNGTGVTLTINGDLSIDRDLVMTDGNITVNDGISLNMTANASDVTESATSRVEGTVSFAPRTLLSSGTLELMGVNFISGNNTLNNLVITRVSGTQGQQVDEGGNQTINVTWQLTSDDVPDAWNVQFSWPDAFDNGNALTDMILWRNGGSDWAQYASGLTATASAGVTTLETVVFNSFSDYTASDNSVALPVELIDFTVTENDGHGMISWSTLSERNAEVFEIEKSLDGENFVRIASVPASGYSDIRVNYEFVDTEVFSEDIFYRLRMVDFDGSFEYSEIIYLQVSRQSIIYPNPTKGEIFIPAGNALSGTLQLMDQTGRVLSLETISEPRLQLSVKPGVYIYTLTIGNITKQGKLIIE